MRYAIWNNKGGVGKSFLTFVLSTEYARLNPDKNIYVIDMCPQANVSEIVLGGNGEGSKNLDTLLKVGLQRQTIGGYFDARLNQPHVKTGTESTFYIKASDYNDKMPSNFFLIAGDPSLEVQTEAINQIAGQSLPREAWKNVHAWVKDLATTIEAQHPDSTFFIDCNPSFAAYTELAVVAAEKLIVPCTADGSSARAIENIGQLIYGHNVPEQYEDAIFSKRVIREGMSVPSIKTVILNRSTQYNNKASKAFGAMFKEIKERAQNLISSEPKAKGNRHLEETFQDIPDTHSVAIVASHHGLPVNQINVGSYEVHDEKPQVNQEPLDRYKAAIKAVAETL